MLKAGWSISLSKIKNVKIKNQNDNAKCKIGIFTFEGILLMFGFTGHFKNQTSTK